jgi:SAM-dependent methyltransferase
MRAPAYELTRCIVCGSSESSEVAAHEEIQSEIELLWAFHGKRLRPSTPPERLADRLAFSEHPPWRVVECAVCGFVYRNPIERERDLLATYSDEAPPPDALRSLHDGQRRSYRVQARRVLRELGRRGTGLEVGSYVGAFLSAAREIGLSFEGVDVNAEVNDFARSLGFNVHDGVIETLGFDRTYDAVAIWNCFDQLPDPRRTMYAAWKLLRPGGVLALRLPNGAFYARRRDELSRGGWRAGVARALLAHNNLLTFPYRYGFTPHSIAMLLGAAGFEVRRITGDVLVPVADEWTWGWAAVEERVVKRLWGWISRRRLAWAPWIEVYARRVATADG